MTRGNRNPRQLRDCGVAVPLCTKHSLISAPDESCPGTVRDLRKELARILLPGLSSGNSSIFRGSANPVVPAVLHSRAGRPSWRSQTPVEAQQAPRAQALWKVPAVFISFAMYEDLFEKGFKNKIQLIIKYTLILKYQRKTFSSFSFLGKILLSGKFEEYGRL